jgi:hypothetical protein
MSYRLFLPLVFLSFSYSAFAQFDYDMFKSYDNSVAKLANRKINSVTEYQLQKGGAWLKVMFQQFNLSGLPDALIQYNEKGEPGERKDFVYDSKGQILKIESYKGKKHSETTEFEFNVSGEMVAYSIFVYSSLNGEKMLFRKAAMEYYSNKVIKKKIEMDGKDTSEVNFFDDRGQLTRSLMNEGGLRTKKIIYVWNKDKTIMKENHYENDKTIYSVITHKYKNGNEIQMLDKDTSPQPFYWKYDKDGRVIETNEGLFDIVYNTYNSDGRLVNKAVKILFSDSNEKDLPKTIRYKYEYQLRQ